MELSPRGNKYHKLFEITENSINTTNIRIVNKYISNVNIFMFLFAAYLTTFVIKLNSQNECFPNYIKKKLNRIRAER